MPHHLFQANSTVSPQGSLSASLAEPFLVGWGHVFIPFHTTTASPVTSLATTRNNQQEGSEFVNVFDLVDVGMEFIP